MYEKEKTYSLLALFFLIDNNIIKEKNKINSLFDVVINEIKQEKEIKNLLIYKKALYNSDSIKENDLMQILNPIINSESIIVGSWKRKLTNYGSFLSYILILLCS